MQRTLGTFNKGKKVSNTKKGHYAILKGQLKKIEIDRKRLESELADKINKLCDLIESKQTNDQKKVY